MRTADTRRRRLRHYRQPPAVSARVVVAGRTSTTSQKVHNLLCGLAAAASSKSDYVLCLDDDVTMHESALAELVAYKRYPASLLVTGYPHDSVSTQASLWTYCMMAYHLPLSIPFSLRDETQFVWGGCMLFEAEDLAPGCQIVQRSWEVGSEE